MAFGAKRIYPIDTKPGTGVGVAIPFNAPGVFKTTYTTKEATKSNLINFFLTNKNERYLNPNFGGNLRAFIFQQITTGNLDSLKEDIQYQLGLYFPQIIIDSLEITSSEDYNQVNVILKYNVKDTGLTDVVEIVFT
jgi:phage baseplate assembly protein W